MATSRTIMPPRDRTDPRAGAPQVPGFTLLEILIVLVILAMVGAMVGPALAGRVGSARFKETITQVEAAMVRARADAQRAGGVFEVVARRQGETVRIIEREAGFAEPGASRAGAPESGAARERVIFELPAGYSLGAGAPAVRAVDSGAEGMAPPPELIQESRGAADSEGAVLVMFLPDGGAAPGAGGVTLSDSAGRSAELKINSWTGAVSFKLPSPATPGEPVKEEPAAMPAAETGKVRGRRRGARRRTPARRGALLLETMVALAVFVAGGLAVMTMVNRGAVSMRLARDYRGAVDLARSAMAKIEAGIANAQTLNGPVPAWDPSDDVSEDEGGSAGGGFADAPPTPSGWELEITTVPSEYNGLTMVTVHAFRRASEGSERVRASYTLRQLVRLVAGEKETVGEDDPLAAAAKQGLRAGRSSAPGSAPEGGAAK